MSRSLGVVVPAFKPDLERLSTYVAALQERLDPTEIRVEIDVPTDESIAKLDDLPVSVGVAPYRRGKGRAITAGFEALDTDVLSFADADGSTPAESMAAVVDPVLADEADLAVGSRRHPDATVHSHQTLARRYLGDGFAFLGRLLLSVDLHDFQCGAKAVAASTWEEIRQHIYEPGFAWDIELIAMSAAINQRILEVPIDWEDRPGSTVSPIRTTVSMGRALFVARHRAKQLRDSRLHKVLAAGREEQPALIDRDDADL
ncbi:MAG: glycosyltransferase [Halorientalis sp.]